MKSVNRQLSRMSATTVPNWVEIRHLSRSIREPQIMELLEAASISIDRPERLECGPPNSRDNGFCRLSLQSEQDTKAFIEKINNSRMNNNKGRKLWARMSKIRGLTLKDISQIENAKWLKITHLSPKVTEEQLTQHIRNETNVIPKCIEIFRHVPKQKDYPTIAFVQIEDLNDTKKVMRKLHMTSLEGQRVWIRQHVGLETERNEYLRGLSKRVDLWNLPSEIDGPSEIEKLCAEYGKVEKVKLRTCDTGAYYTRRAEVRMSSSEEAAAVFDALHGKEFRGCIITTANRTKNVDSRTVRTLLLTGNLEGVSKPKICAFLTHVVKEPPLRIVLHRNNQECSEMSVSVVFSDQELVQKCITKLNGKTIRGNVVIKLQERRRGHIFAAIMTSTVISMENLPRTVTEGIITDHLRKYAKITNEPKCIRLLQDSNNETKMGYAIVELQSCEDAQMVINNINLTEIEGTKCWIQLAEQWKGRNESQKGKSTEVVLRSLNREITRQQITSLCEKYVNVKYIKLVPRGENGYPGIMAKVTMTKFEEADYIFDALNGFKVDNIPIWTSFMLGNQPKILHRERRRKKSVKMNVTKLQNIKVKTNEIQKMMKKVTIKTNDQSKGNKLNAKRKRAKLKQKITPPKTKMSFADIRKKYEQW